jgi:hypothetical protein
MLEYYENSAKGKTSTQVMHLAHLSRCYRKLWFRNNGGAVPFCFSAQWICPRHKVACECSSAVETDTNDTIEDIIHDQWSTDSDRNAVKAKLADCSVRSMVSLRRVISTPVWNSKLNRTFWHRQVSLLLFLRVSV